MNAIAHRNYRSTANVQVYIFQGRVEVVTPGGIPAGMREEDLGSNPTPQQVQAPGDNSNYESGQNAG